MLVTIIGFVVIWLLTVFVMGYRIAVAKDQKRYAENQMHKTQGYYEDMRQERQRLKVRCAELRAAIRDARDALDEAGKGDDD